MACVSVQSRLSQRASRQELSGRVCGAQGGRRPREVPSTLIPWTLLLGNPGAWPQGANYVRGLELSLSLSPRGWMTGTFSLPFTKRLDDSRPARGQGAEGSEPATGPFCAVDSSRPRAGMRDPSDSALLSRRQREGAQGLCLSNNEDSDAGRSRPVPSLSSLWKPLCLR